MNAVLLWALPNDWTQFELLAPDVDERVEAEVRRRFDGARVEEDDVNRLIATQIQALREYAQDGVVLFATRAERAAGESDPPPGLSLTLALANRPAGPAEESAPQSPAGPASSGGVGEAGSSSSRTAPVPVVLKDPEMTAFTIEEQAEIIVNASGTTLNRFQAQVFVAPKDQGGMAVVTVTTFDPGRTEDARTSAREFADTLTFLAVDEADDEP